MYRVPGVDEVVGSWLFGVHTGDSIRVDQLGVAESPVGALAVVGDQYQDPGGARLGCRRHQFELGGHPHVVTASAQHEHHQEGKDDDDDPGAMDELDGGDHDKHHTGDGGTDGVDGHRPSPTRFAGFDPVADHAGLADREGGEDAHPVELDEATDFGVEDDQ